MILVDMMRQLVIRFGLADGSSTVFTIDSASMNVSGSYIKRTLLEAAKPVLGVETVKEAFYLQQIKYRWR